MSGSSNDLAADKLLHNSLGALSDTKHELQISPAITSTNSGHKTSLPSLFNDVSNAWPPKLWLPKNTSSSMLALPGPSIKRSKPGDSLEAAYHLQKRNLQDAIERYMKFIPRINQVNADNFGAVLIDVVKETEHQAPLEDFFRLLYTIQPPGSIPVTLDHHNLLLRFSTIEANLHGLAICRLIHDTFMNPLFASTYFGVNTDKFLAANVNPHEFHRIFLATKILLYCVKEAEGPHTSKASLVKASIFNIYQIYILRLLSANSSIIDRESSPESLILGQASIGRLMRVIFTNAGSKRLGKRGNSKYHFTGVAWRETALDNDIRHLIQLEPSQVKRHLESILQKAPNKPVPALKKSRTHMTKPDSTMQRAETLQRPLVSTPFLSYVKSSSRFPAVDFSSRVKEFCPRKVPAQPKWLREVMKRSIKALEQYNVYLQPSIDEFHAGHFRFGPQGNFYRVVSGAEKTFYENCWDDAYLHLHIAILSSSLPTVLASDEEISPALKILFRASTRKFIKELEEKESGRSPFEKSHRRIFTSNLRKLVNISETILVVLPKELATIILQAVIEDLGDLGKEGTFPGEGSTLDNICAQSAISMFNAHPHIFPTGKEYKDSLISRFVASFQEMCTEAMMHLRCVLEEVKLGNSQTKVEGLPLEILKLYIEACHKWLLHRDFFLEIPIPVVKFFFTKLHGEVQSVNFLAFGKRHPQISTEVFKNWWLITSSVHEYFIVISELVALSQHFD